MSKNLTILIVLHFKHLKQISYHYQYYLGTLSLMSFHPPSPSLPTAHVVSPTENSTCFPLSKSIKKGSLFSQPHAHSTPFFIHLHPAQKQELSFPKLNHPKLCLHNKCYNAFHLPMLRQRQL